MLKVDHTSYDSKVIPLLANEGCIDFGVQGSIVHDTDLRTIMRLQITEQIASRCVGLLLEQTTHTWFRTPDGGDMHANTAQYKTVYLGCCGLPGKRGAWFMDIATILDTGEMDIRTAGIVESLAYGELEQFETEAAFLRAQAKIRLGGNSYTTALLADS